MIKLLTSLLLFTGLNGHTSSPKASAIASMKALFPGLGDSKSIKTKGCTFQKDKWMGMILTKQSFEEKIKFNKSCDLQGNFTVKMDTPFPVNLEVRGLKGYKRILSNLMFNIAFEENVVLNLAMKNTVLKGSKDLVFDLEYALYFDPTPKDPFKKHKGGKLYIKRHGKTKINKTYPLNFKKK